MAEAYSGLRRRRKRTHSSKCPCCISDDVEPENEGSAGNEELQDPNNKKEVGQRQTKRRRIVKKKEDDYRSDSEVSDYAAVVEKEKKTNSKKAKLRSSCNSSPANEKETNKDTKNFEKDADKNAKVPKNNNGKKGTTVNSRKKETKGNGKNNISSQKSASENVSDDDISLSSLKASRSKKKGSTSIESETSGKKKKSKDNTKESNKKKSTVNKNKKSKIQHNNEPGSNALENEDARTQNGNGRQTGNKKTKGKARNLSLNAAQASKSALAGDSSANKVIQPRKSRVKNIVLSSKVSQITQVKNTVFDHLFEELKSCLGNKNLSVKEAGDMLMKISAEDLRLALRSAGLGTNSEEDRSSFGRLKNQNTGLAGQERKAISDTEEIVSQAAEALVSFRSKSPLSREKENKVETKNPVTTGVVTKTSTAVRLEQSFVESQKHTPAVVTTGSSLSSTQVVQALVQIQASSVLSPQILQTHVTSSPSQSLVQGQGYLAVSLPQQFQSQGSPAGMNTSFPSIMPMVASHGALPSFSQIAAQLRPPPMQGGVQPPLLNAGVANPTVPTSVMLPSPNLVQPQLQPNVPIPNPVSTNKLQALTAIKNTGTPIEAPGNKGASNQKQILPQQPLKGMEEVVGNVGNVGTNVPPIVWSLKPPVVFLGSPQNLGGVPRNLMATSANQGVNVNPSKDQPGYSPVALRPGSSSESTRINHGTVNSVPTPNVLTLGGRPILPRTQPRSAEDASGKRPIAAQSNLAFVTTSLGSPGIFPVQSTTPAVLGKGAVTQVSSVLNPARTGLVAVSVPGNSLQVNTTIGNLTSQNISECAGGDCSSPTSVTAKQAVKKLVHERTKTAELKREASSTGGSSTKLKTILPSPPKLPETTTITTTSSAATISDNPDLASKNSEFNLEQAATALLSIGVPDGSDMLKSSLNDTLKEDPDEDVVFTSKGMFRVGDVDVDPHYNRIGREGYTCGKCNKIFTSLSYLARHIKRVCPDMSCRKWKCSMCDKAFRHPFGLQQHVYTHTGERPHKCPICPKAFYSSNDLRRHSRIHSGERPYICKHCDKSFATTISLKTHTYIHTGEKPHKCPQCPKTFATSSKLGRHIVTHSEQRPFSCEQCPKSFNRSGDLRRHNMAVHEGKEKSFECDVCAMTFTKSADLRRHSTTHNPRPQKTLECADCGTQFSTPICLKMHRETYHKTPPTTTTTSTDTEKPSTCDICGKTYSSSALLAKHKATHEPTSTAGYDASQFQHIAPKPVEQTSEPPSG